MITGADAHFSGEFQQGRFLELADKRLGGDAGRQKRSIFVFFLISLGPYYISVRVLLLLSSRLLRPARAQIRNALVLYGL